MRRIVQTSMFRSAVVFGTLAGTALTAVADDGFHNQSVTMTAVTGATGTITQLNYNESGGAVQSLLVNANVLLSFPTSVCSGVASLGVAGNSVTYTGTAVTFSSGFQSVNVTAFTNNTTKAAYTQAVPAKPVAYPAAAGSVGQLNYGPDGSVNGFLFAPSGGGAKIFVDIGPRPNGTLTPLLKTGAAVSVVGTLEAPVSCAPAGTPAEVDASSLTFGTTVVSLGGFH